MEHHLVFEYILLFVQTDFSQSFDLLVSVIALTISDAEFFY